MKNVKKLITCLVALTMAVTMLFSLVACEKSGGNGDAGNIEVSVTASKSELDSTAGANDSATITVTVTGAKDATYTISVSDDTVLKVEGNTVTVLKEIGLDAYHTVTATSNADKNKSGTVTFLVKAPKKEGQVGDLTSAKIQALGEASLTITGEVVDHYTDFNASYNNKDNKYDFDVQLSDGKWNGSWKIKDSSLTNEKSYRRGENTIKYTDIDGKTKTGHELLETYVDKHNTAATKTVKDYLSIPVAWEAQHLWNHIGQLDVNKFTYDVDTESYAYGIDLNSSDDLFLMAYLTASLNPMLDPSTEFFNVFRLILDDSGAITGAYARTEILYDGGATTEAKDASSMSYSEITFTFSNVGSTTVADPSVYEADNEQDSAMLQNALDNMANAKSYEFQAIDHATRAPSTDDGDYSLESATASSSSVKTAVGTTLPLYNHTSATGTVGMRGWVTESVILLAETGKYSYSMDDKLYHTEYSGYKQINSEYYERFEYAYTKTDGVITDSFFQGQERVYGNISSILPDFDFSADMFICTNRNTKKGEATFELLNTVVTRDISMSGSPYEGAYGYDSTEAVVTIVVDTNNNTIKSFEFPYNISDNYYGTYEVRFSKVGTAELPYDNLFDNYVERVWRSTWDLFETKYYYPTHKNHYYDTDGSMHYYSGIENAGTAMKAVYGDKGYKSLPSPEVFMKVFGDGVFGPFFSYKQIGTDASENPIYNDWFSVNMSTDKYDENSMVDDATYEEIINQLKTELAKKENGGFIYDSANSRTDGGTTGRQDRYVTMYNDDIQVVIWNNYTKNFSVTFYKAGTWTLS